jgi:hypothetical protein
MRRRVSFLAVLLVLASVGAYASIPARAQEQVYTDTMDSAETGLLSVESPDPAVTYAYQNGQYLVQASTPSFEGELSSYLSVPEMASSRLTVDATLDGDPTGKYVMAGCRASGDNDGYALAVFPGTGEIVLYREDPGESVVLASMTAPTLVQLGNATNQVGIDCSINIITGIVNGEPVLSIFDATYSFGTSYIGAGASGEQTDSLTVGFDNLTVTDKGNLALGPATPIPPAEPTLGAAPVSPDVEMAPIRDPHVDPTGTLSDAFLISLNLPPAVSATGGDTEVGIDNVSKLSSGASVADFYAEFHYATPTLPANTAYLVGFCFWVDPAGSCYDVYLEDNGTGAATWGYGYDPADGDYQSLQTGTLPSSSVDPTPGADNFLSLTVYQGIAILSGNTFDAAAVIPLQGTPVMGDVSAEVGFLSSAQVGTVAPLPMSISDFAVWDLSSGMAPAAGRTPTEQPALGPTVAAPPTAISTVVAQPTVASAGAPVLPAVQSSGVLSLAFQELRDAALAHPPLASGSSGTLVQMADLFVWETSNVRVRDFYTIVTFTNPDDLSTLSDFGIGFRASNGAETGFRFIIRSNGEWFLEQAGQGPFDSGPAASLDQLPGATNTLELLVQGTAGIVSLNGDVLTQVDLSAVAAPGDVYIGTGFFNGDTVPDRQVPYQNWWVYPTDILDVKSG